VTSGSSGFARFNARMAEAIEAVERAHPVATCSGGCAVWGGDTTSRREWSDVAAALPGPLTDCTGHPSKCCVSGPCCRTSVCAPCLAAGAIRIHPCCNVALPCMCCVCVCRPGGPQEALRALDMLRQGLSHEWGAAARAGSGAAPGPLNNAHSAASTSTIMNALAAAEEGLVVPHTGPGPAPGPMPVGGVSRRSLRGITTASGAPPVPASLAAAQVEAHPPQVVLVVVPSWCLCPPSAAGHPVGFWRPCKRVKMHVHTLGHCY
jgi:hypothetical protein